MPSNYYVYYCYIENPETGQFDICQYSNDPEVGVLLETPLTKQEDSPANGRRVIILDETFHMPREADYLFAGMTNGFSEQYFNPKKGSFLQCQSAQYMFRNCKGLTDISLFGGTDFVNVSTIRGMFGNCENLEMNSLDVNCASVQDMAFMFYFCKKLKNVTLTSNFYTSANLKTIQYMFGNCQSLESLRLEFSTWRVTNMNGVCGGCRNMTSYRDTFDTQNVETLEDYFGSCAKLREIDISHWNISKVTNMFGTFNNCSSLENIFLPSSIPHLTDCTDCFSMCPNLKNIVAPIGTDGDLGASVDSTNMFDQSPKLRNFDPSILGITKANNLDEKLGYFTYGIIKRLNELFEKTSEGGILMDVFQRDSEGWSKQELYF